MKEILQDQKKRAMLVAAMVGLSLMFFLQGWIGFANKNTTKAVNDALDEAYSMGSFFGGYGELTSGEKDFLKSIDSVRDGKFSILELIRVLNSVKLMYDKTYDADAILGCNVLKAILIVLFAFVVISAVLTFVKLYKKGKGFTILYLVSICLVLAAFTAVVILFRSEFSSANDGIAGMGDLESDIFNIKVTFTGYLSTAFAIAAVVFDKKGGKIAASTLPEHALPISRTAATQGAIAHCSFCGTALKAGTVFCPNCGNKNVGSAPDLSSTSGIQPAKFCPICGAKVPSGSAYCPNCGFKMSDAMKDSII